MYSASYVIAVLAIGMVFGAVIALVAVRVLIIDPMQRSLNDAHRRTKRALELTRPHRGTPYRPETVAAARKPGLRLVDGEPMYSSEWLNELRTVKP